MTKRTLLIHAAAAIIAALPLAAPVRPEDEGGRVQQHFKASGR